MGACHGLDRGLREQVFTMHVIVKIIYRIMSIQQLIHLHLKDFYDTDLLNFLLIFNY